MRSKIADLIQVEIETLFDGYIREVCEKLLRRKGSQWNAIRETGARRRRGSAETLAVEEALLSEVRKSPGLRIGALGEKTGYSGARLYHAAHALVLKSRIRAVGLAGTKTYFPL